MKKYYLTLLLVFSFISCHAQITQINDMAEVFEYFREADSNTLAVFDVDMVLIQPSDPAFQMTNMKRFSPTCKKVMDSVPSEKRIIFLGLMTICSDSVLVDERTFPQYFSHLQGKNIPAIALTANLTGEFGHVKNMETMRINSLDKLGINFAATCPHKEPLLFKQLPTFRGNYTTYKNGMLFVNGVNCPKGDALLAFLEASRFVPKRIVFVDDREENLKNVEEAVQRLKQPVEYNGLLYTGAKNYPSEMISEEAFEARWKDLASKAMNLE